MVRARAQGALRGMLTGLCRSMTNVFYFGQAQTVGLTLFGITAGVIMRFTHRYKVCLPLSPSVQF